MSAATAVAIGGRLVGDRQPVFVIAEAGVNHNGDLEIARRLIDAAADAGADAVKFQAFITEALITRETPKAAYQRAAMGGSPTQYDMLKALELSPGQLAALKGHCEHAGVLFLCTPYDAPSVAALEAMDVAAFKVASTDTTNIPLLRQLAATGRPVILSTGMSDLGEVQEAVDALRGGGLTGRIVVLQCTSEYPSPAADVNLRAIATMEQALGCPVGFSDHSGGLEVAAWAVAAGACMVETHFTLDRMMPGPDHRASLEPAGLQALVQRIRLVEAALGDGVKRVMPSEAANKAVMQKSLVAARAVRAGEPFAADALTCKRPATGLAPRLFDRVIGRRAARDIAADEILSPAAVEWEP